MAARMDRISQFSHVRPLAIFFGVCLVMLVSGCASKPEVLPQQTFWENLNQLCGKAYPGRMVEDSTHSPLFREKPLLLHVAECDGASVRMPLLIDGRPWATLIVSRNESGLVIEHQHEVGDGGGGPPSGYGGSTRGTGTEVSQDFYASEFTIALDEDAENTVWTIELRTGAVLQYGLRREGTDRRFRAAFDLSRGRPAPTVAPMH